MMVGNREGPWWVISPRFPLPMVSSKNFVPNSLLLPIEIQRLACRCRMVALAYDKQCRRRSEWQGGDVTRFSLFQQIFIDNICRSG